MVVEANCEIPEGLYYYIEGKNTVWLKVEGNIGIMGITDLAQTMAGRIVKIRIKSPGTKVERGRPIATLESGKWAGPVPAPVSCEIVEKNSEVEKSPILINQDPYGRGWIAKIKILNPEELKKLYTGAAAVQKIKELIASEKITCKRL
ncbi:MAG: glycine cleavage system protein H [Sulfolobaceae archaeon]